MKMKMKIWLLPPGSVWCISVNSNFPLAPFLATGILIRGTWGGGWACVSYVAVCGGRVVVVVVACWAAEPEVGWSWAGAGES